MIASASNLPPPPRRSEFIRRLLGTPQPFFGGKGVGALPVISSLKEKFWY